jgi:indole-3-glycerol phosphate synthase
MSVLNQICTDKAEHVKAQKTQTPLVDLQAKIKNIDAPKGFINRIRNFTAENKIPLITEVKKASPSKGIIREDFEPVEIAKIYEASGAACLSVLTDEPYFQGKDEYLTAIRAAVSLPMLRKDFMIDPYQIYESRALGADCILIIMAALEDSLAAELYALSTELGMDALVEVHNMEELERAMKLTPAMVGVNNRNLKTLEVDLNVGMELAKALPDTVLKIGESGIYTHDDILALQKAGFEGFLIGESLMREPDIGLAVKKITGTN